MLEQLYYNSLITPRERERELVSLIACITLYIAEDQYNYLIPRLSLIIKYFFYYFRLFF